MSKEISAIGIDLGGTNIKGVLINASGDIMKSLVIDTNSADSDVADGKHWKNEIVGMVEQLKDGVVTVAAIGLSAPGLSNDRNSAIAHMPKRLQGLENFKWQDLFKHPDVRVLNDAHAALMAESSLGAGKGIQNQLMLTLGTGVGGAVMIGGKLYQGFLQRAGHVGHMSLNSEGVPGILDIPGTLEEAFGNASVANRTNGKFNSCRELVEGYNKGDILATYFWLNAVQKLSLALASLINILSPELIILSGGITKAGESLMGPLTAFMERYEWRPGGIQTKICLSAFNEFSGAVGAALYSLTCKTETKC
ncbi:MAG: ROK family protein [Chitinophagaceae bacterium]